MTVGRWQVIVWTIGCYPTLHTVAIIPLGKRLAIHLTLIPHRLWQHLPVTEESADRKPCVPPLVI